MSKWTRKYRPWQVEPTSVRLVLYLVRHGRTEQNASRRLLGRMDVPMDELGVRQASALADADFLRGAKRVVTSPLKRARDTAAGLGLPVTVDERWTEIDYGIHDGAELDAVPDLFRQWSLDLDHRPEGGESLASVGKRVREACEELWDEASSVDVVVVSHVSPIKAAVAWALGVGDEVCWRMFVDVASVSCLAQGRGWPVLRTFNETRYRPSE
jgi:broad specificity phosphatase PhoE